MFIVERLGGVLPLSIALGGVALGPSMGMFSLGMLVPRSNSKVISKKSLKQFRAGVFMCREPSGVQWLV